MIEIEASALEGIELINEVDESLLKAVMYRKETLFNKMNGFSLVYKYRLYKKNIINNI